MQVSDLFFCKTNLIAVFKYKLTKMSQKTALVTGFICCYEWWRFIIIIFFYIHEKKILDSRKFSTSGFPFFEICNTIWPFLENVTLSVGRSVCLYVFKVFQLHFDIIWCWLDFGAHGSKNFDVVRIFLIS